MIQFKNISKSFGKKVVLEDLNLSLKEDMIYGLLGRNGVGKTTLLSILTGQYLADRGEILLNGEPILENPRALSQICFVKESPVFSRGEVNDLKVKDYIRLARIAYPDWDQDFFEHLIKEFPISMKAKAYKLSRGQQTVVSMIIGLASRAPITIFDEPTLGLDAVYREKFYSILLSDYEEHPRMILISTHQVVEAENIFEEVVILKEKGVLLTENVGDLLSKAFYLSGDEAVIRSILPEEWILHQDRIGSRSIVGAFGELTEVQRQKMREQNIEYSSMNLQKLFIYLTEEKDHEL